MLPIKANKVTVTSKYGMRTITVNGVTSTGMHNGIDLVANPNNRNEDILAFADGEVVSLQRTGAQYGTGCFVRLKHANGFQTLYYHQASGTIPAFKVGDKVKKGDYLGKIGTTGNSTGVHLHFQIDKGSNSTSVDPWEYLFNGKELVPSTSTPPSTNKTNDELAREVIAGNWGNGADRVQRLTAAGYDATAVQKIVNEMLANNKPSPSPTPPSQSSYDLLELTRRTIRGDFGNGDARKNALGDRYAAVQNQVNLNIKNGTTRWENIKIYH